MEATARMNLEKSFSDHPVNGITHGRDARADAIREALQIQLNARLATASDDLLLELLVGAFRGDGFGRHGESSCSGERITGLAVGPKLPRDGFHIIVTNALDASLFESIRVIEEQLEWKLHIILHEDKWKDQM